MRMKGILEILTSTSFSHHLIFEKYSQNIKCGPDMFSNLPKSNIHGQCSWE